MQELGKRILRNWYNHEIRKLKRTEEETLTFLQKRKIKKKITVRQNIYTRHKRTVQNARLQT